MDVLRTVGLALVVAALAGGCAVAPSHPALKDVQLTDMVPVRDFVASRQSTGGYRVSPDGRRMAWFGTDGVVPAVWVKTIDGERSIDAVAADCLKAVQALLNTHEE